ncbi:MAG TPA: undecaprenyl/decaprenyl-phosphate alpha-N-acetylglucosaminyl 1-phosphate transferase [Candidatus Scatomorpha stercorigallinarum]|nr:undecaprenyl/decaprenyl-phosphate alpha-N-acetylglucosaminyl 1-phosphate transferase [Candidatus Scatomorpha stercorigallinarum]
MIQLNALWLRILLTIGVGFAISFAATPIVKSFAQKVGAIDVPRDARRVHDHPIPRMGGLAIFLGFLISVLLFVDVTQQIRGILLGAVLIVACGAIDDVISLRAWIKLLIQIAAAVIAVAHGVVIEVFRNPNIFSENEALILGALAVPVTILWIVGITNSVNLIDGLDGLAVGVSTIASTTMFIVALLVSESNVAVILAALMGACLGFMPYNLNPAKIFMGDTGALLLGYVLSTVSVVGMFKFYAVVTFVVPILALALPLFDTLCAIIRRLLRGQSPMHPDRGHLHHRLIDMGLSQKQAVAILYSISAILGLCAVVLATSGTVRIYLLVVAVLAAVAVGIFIKRTFKGHKYHPPVDPSCPGEEEHMHRRDHPDEKKEGRDG